MRVLIGCEFSGRVRDAFAALGHDAWSCDLVPSESVGNHLQCDIMDAIKSGPWDLIGLHPLCTAMSLSGNGTYGGGKPKHQDRIKAQEWTKNLWQSAIATGAKVYLEQPMSVLCQVLGKRTQAIHPWEHGHGETKETWLWLHGLKPLMPSEISLGRENRIWKMGPSPTRTADRSRTYPGIAKAMADQWGR